MNLVEKLQNNFFIKSKAYSYLIDDGSEDKKAKEAKSVS